MKRIRVALFAERCKAEGLRRHLEQSSIPAIVRGEGGWVKLWFLTERQSGVRVEVSATAAERVWDLLVDKERWLADAICCPECGSFRIDYPQFTEKSLLTNLAMGLISEVGFLEKQYYCEDCHCMWSKPRGKSSRARAHQAPDYFLEDVHSLPLRAKGATSLNVNIHERVHRPLSLAQPGPRDRFFRSRWRWTLLNLVTMGGIFLLLGGSRNLFAGDTQFATGKPAGHRKLAVTPGNSTDSQAPTYLRDIRPILMGKCARCHNGESRILQNWMNYAEAARRRWEIKRRIWDSWAGAYFKQPMPIENSPEHAAITDEERVLIREWAESGAALGEEPPRGIGLPMSEKIVQGKKLFGVICATCHQQSGQGIPGRFPPLAGSSFLNADKHRAIKVVVNGLQGEIEVNGQKFNNSMPKFPLSDDDIANALTFVFNSFGNSGKEVTPEEVGEVRGEPNDLNSHGQSLKAPEEKSPYE